MMEYVIFSQVDAVTRVPITEAPAANGPEIPQGIQFGFALESRYPMALPLFYGFMEGETEAAAIISTISKAQYDAAYEAEMEARVRKNTLTRISKYDLIMRLTDAEADTLLADFNDAPGKLNFLWNSILYVDQTDPAYPILQSVIVNRLGEARAAEVLAPTE